MQYKKFNATVVFLISGVYIHSLLKRAGYPACSCTALEICDCVATTWFPIFAKIKFVNFQAVCNQIGNLEIATFNHKLQFRWLPKYYCM